MRSLIADVKDKIGEEVEVSGWAQNIRIVGSLAFIDLRDVSGNVQCILFKKNNPDIFNELKVLSRESILTIKGKAVKSQAKLGYEIQIDSLNILNRAKTPLPIGIIDPVETDLETRLENRFIDLRKPQILSIFKIQSTIANSIRDYFYENGFIEIHTPKIVAAATEGGTELFPVKYFEREAYLSQSPQLYKEIMMSAGFDKVFEIAPAFRAEEHNTTKHLNEFTSIDIEMSFSDDEKVMSVLEDIIKVASNSVNERNKKELEILNVNDLNVNYKFKRITYSDYIKMANEKGIEIKDGEDLTTPIFKAVGGGMKEFYFITRWPRSLKPFYVQPHDDIYSKGFDLQFGEIEITSGAQRVHDPEVLISNLKNKGLNVDSFSFYVKAFQYGMPPHAGWAIGLERLTMVLLNLVNIREATLFPRDRTRITP
ncbi:MAG: aspartate--tRNA(Asn) ligase [Thermoplasmata archaeon]